MLHTLLRRLILWAIRDDLQPNIVSLSAGSSVDQVIATAIRMNNEKLPEPLGDVQMRRG